MRGADDNVVTLHGAAAASSTAAAASMHLAPAAAARRSPGRVGWGPAARANRRLSGTPRGDRLATPLCCARRGSSASACSRRTRSQSPFLFRFAQGRRAPRELLGLGGAGQAAGPGGTQCRRGGRAEPGSGSRPSGSGGGGGGSSIPRARRRLSELPLLAGMSVIIVSGVAGPLH